MSPPLRLSYVTSAPSVGALPESPVEVAFAGRSNVGKSSLINALANRKDLAHTSRTPGRTQLLMFYSLSPRGSVVDLPGYGYAAVSRATRGTWPAMIEKYLLGRDALTRLALLVDGEIGPTKLDLATLDWLRANEVPHQVVATKADKVKSSLRQRRAVDLARGCSLEPGDVPWVSASTGAGVDALRALVRLWMA